MPHGLSLKTAFNNSYQIIKHNFLYLLGLFLIQIVALSIFFTLVTVVGNSIAPALCTTRSLQCIDFLSRTGLPVLSTYFFYIMLMMGTKQICMNLFFRQKGNYMTLFEVPIKSILLYIGATIIYVLGSMLGFIFFIIPYFIYSTHREFYDLIIIDGTEHIFESFALSKKLVEGNALKIFEFEIMYYIAVSLSGGLLYPFFLCARIDMYNQLRTFKNL